MSLVAAAHRGSRLTAIKPALVIDHEHHLPLKYIAAVCQSARDAGNVLVGLHLLELAGQEPSRRGGGHDVGVRNAEDGSEQEERARK